MSTTVYLPRSKRSSLFATLAATALIGVKPVFAQDEEEEENSSATDPAPAPTTAADGSEPTSDVDLPNDETSVPPEPEPTEDPEEEPTSTEEEEDEPTEEPTEEASSTEEENVSITNTGDVATTEMTGIPSITGNNPSQTDDGFLSDAPTLTRGNGIPTYPAAAVPPTGDAPFMQHSTAPDGTVFIAVGSILGAFCLAILLWRIIVSLLLHRSVERAALAQQDANSKSGFPAPPAPFYKYTDQSSTMSLSQGRNAKRTTRGPIPSANLSQSNLFFSPTAAASGNGGNRASAYLPSGFYAAGAGSNNQNHGHSISLTNLRPESRGHGMRDSRITPPDSPSFTARRDASHSSLYLPPQNGQRAPSAYLEDLLADDPGALPPPHMPPSSGPSRQSTGGQNRF